MSETFEGNEFWAVPQGVLTPEFDLIRMTCVSALGEEVAGRDGGALDYMLVERLSFMYAHLRQRETDTENVITDRNRREMLKDWIELSTAMKKIWSSEDRASAGETLLKKLDKVISPIVNELPDTPETRQFKYNLAQGLQELNS